MATVMRYDTVLIRGSIGSTTRRPTSTHEGIKMSIFPPRTIEVLYLPCLLTFAHPD